MSDRRQELMAFLDLGGGQFRHERRLLTGHLTLIEKILKSEPVPAPHFVEIHPSGECNNTCRWCRGPSEVKTPNFPTSMLAKDTLLKLVDEFHRLGVKGVLYDGYYGEPLLNPATVPAMAKAVKLGMQVGLGTNGVLLDRSVRDIAARVNYVRVSLDAGSNETFNVLKGTSGTPFDVILTNLRELVAVRQAEHTGVRIGISYILQPENIAEILSITDKARSVGIDSAQFKLALSDPMGRLTREQIDTAYEQLAAAKARYPEKQLQVAVMQSKEEAIREMSTPVCPDFDVCYAHNVMSVVGPDGNVYACCEHTDRPEESFGNIETSSFEDIWLGRQKQQVMARLRPRESCTVCSRYNTRINRFLGFLAAEYSKDAGFLELLRSVHAAVSKEDGVYDMWQRKGPAAGTQSP